MMYQYSPEWVAAHVTHYTDPCEDGSVMIWDAVLAQFRPLSCRECMTETDVRLNRHRNGALVPLCARCHAH